MTWLPHLTKKDLLYVSYKNDPLHVPFFMASDHERKAVFLAVRGTVSLADAVTDMLVKPESMKEFWIKLREEVKQARKEKELRRKEKRKRKLEIIYGLKGRIKKSWRGAQQPQQQQQKMTTNPEDSPTKQPQDKEEDSTKTTRRTDEDQDSSDSSTSDTEDDSTTDEELEHQYDEPDPDGKAFEGFAAHSGILKAAGNIYKALAVSRQLDKIFSESSACRGYQLILTGHSLGGGSVVLLAFMLRLKFPELKCWAFSPPGGLLNEAAAEESKKFVTVVVVGNDLIPRTSLEAIRTLQR